MLLEDLYFLLNIYQDQMFTTLLKETILIIKVKIHKKYDYDPEKE